MNDNIIIPDICCIIAIMSRKISLTVDERAILQLQEFIPFEDEFEAPEGATQAGIALGVGIERKHVPRAVNKLLVEGLVSDRLAHVKGAKQRKKVYFLTFDGKGLARRIWENLANKEVVIKELNGAEKITTFSELCFTYQVGRTPMELLMELEEGRYYYPHRKVRYSKADKEMEKEDRPNKIGDAKSIYRKALSKAWEDNILTKDEEQLLEELRSALNITKEEHKALQLDVLQEIKSDDRPINKWLIYKSILDIALMDGKITDDEQNMLDELARILGIAEDQVLKVNMKAKLVEGEGIIPKDKEKEVYQNIYSSVLKESLRDGRISRDEENIIKLLKGILSIDDKEHIEIAKKMDMDD